MRNAGRGYWKRLTALVLLCCLLFAPGSRAAAPDTEAPVTRKRILSLAKKYDRSSYFLLKRFDRLGGDLLTWTGEADRLSEVMDVTTHETSHSFMAQPDGQVRYYIGKGRSIRVKYSKVFRTKRIASSIPRQLRTHRFSTYVGRPRENMGSNVDGIYGLMNEFTAYFWGMHMTNALLPWFEKYLGDFDALGDYIIACENGRMAYAEFRYYMLRYLYYAKKHEASVYRGIMKNKDFRRAYRVIEQKYAAQIRRYEKELKRLPQLLQEAGYTAVITDNHVLIYEGDAWGYIFGQDRFSTDYKRLIRVSAKDKYSSIERRLKR